MKKILFYLLLVSFPMFVVRAEIVAPDPQAVIVLVNKEREAKGLPAFVHNSALDRAAELKALDLAKIGGLVHTVAPAGSQWWNTAQAGYVFQTIGENLAVNIFDPNILVKDWMNSPAHSANILNPLFSDIGIAVVPGVFQGTVGSYVVEYTATPKKAKERTGTSIGSVAQYAVAKKPTVVSATTLKNANNLARQEQAASIVRQLIALLSEYMSLLQKA